MTALVVSSLSNEYVRVLVDTSDSGTTVDPTGFPVSFSFESSDAEPTTWVPGEWETDPGPPAKYYARILVGSDGESLVDGSYFVWLRITAQSEIPIRQVGTITID